MKNYLAKVSLDHFAFGLTIPISVVWQLSRGLNLGQIGIVTAVMTVLMVLTDVPTGIVADKFGRKNCLILSTFILSLATTVFFLSKSFLGFIVYAAIASLGWSLLSGAEEAYVYETAVANKAVYRKSISDVTIADEFSTILGLVVSSELVKAFSMRATLAISAGVLMVSFLLAFILLREPRHKNSIEPVSAPVSNVLSDINKFIQNNKILLGLMFVFAVYYEGGRLLWQPQLVSNGLKISSLGIIFALFKAFSVIGSLTVKHREPNKFITEFVVAGGILSVSFFLSGINNLAVIIVGLCLYSFIENYTRVLQSDYINKVIKDNRATFLSINNILRNVYSAALMPLLGYLSIKEVSRGFMLLFILQIVAVLVFLSMYPKLKMKISFDHLMPK